MVDHHAGALRERIGGRGDRHGAFVAACGGFDCRQSQQCQASAAGAAHAVVSMHSLHERVLRGGGVAHCEPRPPHLALHTRDLGQVAHQAQFRERLGIDLERARGVALGEDHLRKEAQRDTADLVILLTLLDHARLVDERYARIHITADEAHHGLDRQAQAQQEVEPAGAGTGDGVRHRHLRIFHPAHAQAAVGHAHDALGRDLGVASGLAVKERRAPLTQGALPFAGGRGDHAVREQREATSAAGALMLGQRQHLIERGARRQVLAGDVPVPVHVAARQQPLFERLRVTQPRAHQAPLDRGHEVGVVASSAVHAGQLRGRADVAGDASRHQLEIVRMHVALDARLAGGVQLLGGECADRLEQRIALAPAHDAHKALLHQRLEAVERERLLGFLEAHLFHRLERPTLVEARELPKQLLLRGIEQRVAPADGGAQRALAQRQVAVARGEQVEGAVQALKQRRRLQDAHPRGGQFERQRQAIEAPADGADRRGVGLTESEARLDLLGALLEEHHRGTCAHGLE